MSRSVHAPESLKKLRSCIRCKLIKTEDQFVKEGCPNCPFLQMQGDIHRVIDATSPNFEGMVAITNNERSWVARHLRSSHMAKGIYSITVTGHITSDIQEILDEHNLEARIV